MSLRHGTHAAYNHPRALARRLRPRSVRAKIVALLMVPVVSLMVLWALATVSTVREAWTLRQLQELEAGLSGPVTELIGALQEERATAARHLALPAGPSERDTLEQRGAGTEAAARALSRTVALAGADIPGLAPEVGRRMDILNRSVRRVGEERGAVTERRQDWRTAYDDYSSAIQDAFGVRIALAEAHSGQSAGSAVALAQIGEMLARQQAVAISAQMAERLSSTQREAFADALGAQRLLTSNTVPGLPGPERTSYQRLLDSDPYRSLAALQDAVLSSPAGQAAADVIPAGGWQPAYQAVTRDVTGIGSATSAAAASEADEASRSALTQSLVTVVLGLLAVLLALLISVQIGRGLVVELTALRDSALELANRRLPQAMRRLRAGEKIDVDADVPVMPPGEGEAGQVGDALNAVQRAALKAAAERAELLTGVSGVFVTLARRSQSLVHRQLSLLDTMERRTEDPGELEDLFRLDHLAARMRRHAEGLIIMSGAAPGRTWSKPVPLMTIVRAAVAEVEEFQRVEVRRMPDVAVRGTAVADLTHMIAELVENATSFSPPNTTVLVHGEPVGAGFVIEIEDRGLGMRPESMAEANRRIAEAHQLDLFASDQLGFFVISRLAHRQGISVTLRRSAYGGTTAVLLLPGAILTQHDTLAADEQDFPSRRPALAARRTVPAGEVSVLTEDARPRPARAARQLSSPGAEEPPPGSSAHGDLAGDLGDDFGDDLTGGLPRRTRQSSIAPGLRDPLGGGPSGSAPTEADRPPRPSPEQARATMSALQQGFIRGRDE